MDVSGNELPLVGYQVVITNGQVVTGIEFKNMVFFD